jgi:predicted DNA-binding transcriptional regulator AlpA
MIAGKDVDADADSGTGAAGGGGRRDSSSPRRMLNEKQVLEVIPVSRTTLYRMEKNGRFPKSTYISPNRRVWFEDEIIGWQNAVNEFDPHRARGKGRRRASR